MKNNLDNRIIYLDFLRFIGLFVVFTFHFMIDINYNRMFDFNFVLSNIYERPNFVIGMVAMIFFFLASGSSLYLSAEKEKNFDIINFYKKRFIKILIPFYISYLIYFIYKIIIYNENILFNGTPFYMIFLTIFGMDEYFNALGFDTFSLGIGEWYLGCIILCYLIFPLLYFLIKKYKKITTILFILYFVFIAGIITNNTIIEPHENFFIHIFNFYMGMYLVSIKKYDKIIYPIIITLFLYIFPINIPIPNYILMSISAISLYIIFYNLDYNDVIIKFLKIFSFCSFEFFLMHHVVINEVSKILGHPPLSRKLVFLYIGDIIITYIIARLIKRLI